MKPRHYVLVVHGIGEQKLNETAVSVALRFAEVRAGLAQPRFRDRILRTHMAVQSARDIASGPGWAEFADIPIDAAVRPQAFAGRPPTRETNGTNFRFVDLGWAELLRAHQGRYGEPTARWTKRLLDDVGRRDDAPDWARTVLHTVRASALQLERVLSLRSRHLAKLVFQDFLGDIHLYGDYARTRGRAVRDVHVCLDEIVMRDFVDWCRRGRDRGDTTPYALPCLTVIAHSLGSVLAFDALTYAHFGDEVRELYSPIQHPCPSLPFPGYDFERGHEVEARNKLFAQIEATGRLDEFRGVVGQPEWRPAKLPSLLWRHAPAMLVTLGSPIDKYLVLWPENYAHLKEPEPVLERREKVLHVNLSDQSDPVGHHLDLTKATPAYAKVFHSLADVVFRRYPWPLVAHVAYWQDTQLFADLLEQIDAAAHTRPEPGRKPAADAPQPLDARARQPLAARAGGPGSRPLYGSRRWPVAAACLIVYFALPIGCAILLWLLVRGTADKPWSGLDVARATVATWLLVDFLPLLARQPPRLGILAALVFAAAYWRRIIMVLSNQRGIGRWAYDLVAVSVLGVGTVLGSAHLLHDGWASLRAGWQLPGVLEALWVTGTVAFATAVSARILLRRPRPRV